MTLVLSVWTLCFAIAWGVARVSEHMAPRAGLLATYLLMCCSVLLPLAFLLMPEDAPHATHAEVSASLQKLHHDFQSREIVRAASSDTAQSTATAGFDTWLAAAMLVSIGLGLTRYGIALRRAKAAIRAAIPIRTTGRLTLKVSAGEGVPYSFSLLGHSTVVLPESLLERETSLRLALSHELQHIRARDTLAIHLLEGFRALFFWCPFAHGLVSECGRLQELACDEALVRRRRVQAQEYGRLLVEAATTRHRSAPQPRCALGQAGRANAIFLKRRIMMILSQSQRPPRRLLTALTALTAGLLMITSSFALGQHGRTQISRDEIETRLQSAMKTSDFPMYADSMVVEKLHHFLVDPRGRSWTRGALRRMEKHRALIEGELAARGLPAELLAVPFIESGFRNLPPSANPLGAAGLWQFLPSTARRYGLQVDDTIDERREPDKATRAALTFLAQLHNTFADWRLALAAYNAGEKKVLQVLMESDTRDAARLVRLGQLPDYLPTVMAGILILKNPDLTD